MATDLVEFERSVVGTVLLRPAQMAHAVAAGVRPDWFTDDAASLVWSALAGFWRAGWGRGAAAAGIPFCRSA